MDEYKVKLQVFEGPLDLLLHLVKINEMDIYDIQIAEVTKQYLEYIRLMQSLDLEVAGEFIVMASTLLNIKLRSLLPDSGEPDEDEEELGDILTAQALMEQLVQYRKFKEAAARLQEQEEQQARIFFRDVALPQFAGIADDGLRAHDALR
ncbi:segregation/condensation protein A, partial [Candidatus Sumerlaeota bacterium]|nr:segregation/condensation protein A [Candidatus Sumerlaeota bacterium]